MIQKILTLLFGSKHERDIKALQPIVDNVNEFGETMKKVSDQELAAYTNKFKERLSNGETLDDILPEAFAVVREAADRILGERPYDVQVMGGIVLHQGKIAEMKTGEGKTLSSTMPIYLNALSGKGVHVVTVNDYLSKRDRNWMGPIYEFFGLSVGVIQHDMPHKLRKIAYDCDITYGTNNEYGFDYLRDNMVEYKELQVQREHNYCIIDEVDSVLVDEARTPLIISGPTEESTDKYYNINKIIPRFIKDEDFELDEKSNTIFLTDEGNKKAEKLLDIENLYDNVNIEIIHHINQALKAHHLFKRDVDYVINEGKVVIVDEFTGRLMPGRRFSDGLHQALEAKESVIIETENQTLASITFQNFFKLYKKLSGMTGTADTEAAEFHEIYKLDVVVIPTNKPMIRLDNPDTIHRTEREKFEAIADDVEAHYRKGQPVLLGTISIEKSETLSRILHKKGIKHQVLNAKYHEKEALIVKEAGKKGMVTIATNMAGRGTDIVLGGYPFFKDDMDTIEHTENEDWYAYCQAITHHDFEKARHLISKLDNKSSDSAQKLLKSVDEWLNQHKDIKELGGVYIIGSERHESRRIDNQLRGRSGRQGDPGMSRFYLSLEDDLMRLFGSDRISGFMEKMGMTDGQEIEHPLVSRAIENAQKRVEGRNFDIRKHLLEFDNVMNNQREFIYNKRNQILDNDNLNEDINDIFTDTVQSQLSMLGDERQSVENWDLEPVNKWLNNLCGLNIEKRDIEDKNFRLNEFSEYITNLIKDKYQARETKIGSEIMRDIERFVFLRTIDNKWKDHLYAMDHLKEGIGLRAYGEKDPLMEYKFEGFRMFKDMLERVKEEVSELLFRIQPSPILDVRPDDSLEIDEIGNTSHQQVGQFSSFIAQKEAPGKQPDRDIRQSRERNQVVAYNKVGRNDMCTCGSGKKYKHCHGRE